MSHDRSVPQDHDRFFSEPALAMREASKRRWDTERAIEIVGRSPQLVDLLRKTQKIAAYDDPVLITGESGTGKESLAAAL